LTQLYQLGFEKVMVEGGAQVITSFLKHRLVDNILLTIAPVFVGGVGAVERLSDPVPDGTGAPGSVLQDDFPRLRGFRTAQVGDDLIVWGKPQWKKH
jgi:riboflavin biosynthesis pyrimidine reductase